LELWNLAKDEKVNIAALYKQLPIMYYKIIPTLCPLKFNGPFKKYVSTQIYFLLSIYV